MRYKNLFFDLDDTLWAFSANARDAFEEIYFKHGLDAFFDSFAHFYALYQEQNAALWVEYGKGEITKEELNSRRFLHPLEAVGAGNVALAKQYSTDYFALIPTKKQLMPHARELLDHLAGRYNLYILSNGFRELQFQKMESGGIAHYFKQVILSEDLGVMKPGAAIFHFALSATQSLPSESLMIGDSWEADIVGARGVGIDHAFYNTSGRTEFPFRPTYQLDDLSELIGLL